MTPNDRYSGVMPRVLIVLALGIFAGLFIPVACHGQERILSPRKVLYPAAADGTTFVRDTTPPDTLPVLSDSAKSAALDSVHALMAKIDSILARTAPWPADPVLMEPRVEVNWRTRSYAGAILLGLAANTVLHIDRDPCTNGQRICFSTSAYHDTFRTPDKREHFSAAYFLTNSASEFGVPKWAAFGLTCGLAGPGFELTQGYVSWKDITADCAGSATALGLQSLLRKMHDAGWLR